MRDPRWHDPNGTHQFQRSHLNPWCLVCGRKARDWRHSEWQYLQERPMRYPTGRAR